MGASNSVQQKDHIPQCRPNEYQYSHLPHDTIRILSLLPKDPLCDEPRFILHQHNLKDKPVFEALSYAWDSAYRRRPVYCYSPALHLESGSDCCRNTADFGSGSRLYVTRNLAAALCRLQPLCGTRELWIDAICINQEDKAERSQQVHLIPEIFRNAKQVLAWIGEEQPNTGISINFLTQVVKNTRAVDDGLDDGKYYYDPKDIAGANAELLSNFGELEWKTIINFCSEERSYWRRLWMVEEITLNDVTTVLCGSYTISWMDLSIASRTLMKCRFEPIYQVASDLASVYEINITRQLFKQSIGTTGSKSGLSLWWLWLIHSKRLCTKPQDHVFAILGLVDSTIRQKLGHLTYAMPLDEILRQAAQTSLQHEGYHLWQSMEFGIDERAQSLPTWAVECSPSRGSLWANFDISKNDKILLRFLQVPRFQDSIMTCQCFIIDVITSTSENFTQANEQQVIQQAVLHEFEAFQDRPWYWTDPLKDAPEESKWNFLAGLCETLTAPLYNASDTKAVQQIFMKWLLYNSALDPETLLSRVPSPCPQPSALEIAECHGQNLKIHNHWEKFRRMARIYAPDIRCAKNIFRTGLGFPGIGPWGSVSEGAAPAVQVGDIIAVFVHCRRPMILRPMENKSYKLVGTAFFGGFERGPWVNPGGLLSSSASRFESYEDSTNE